MGGISKTFNKDGDIVTSDKSPFIYKNCDTYGLVSTYCAMDVKGNFWKASDCWTRLDKVTFATEEEEEKLFKAIEDNGYRWDEETKTLEKLPKFKVGDRVRSIYSNFQYDIKELTDTHYTLVEVESKFKYTERIIEGKSWELVPNKFDINTLVPFESKVLVRNDESQRWLPAFWRYRVIDGFITTFGWSKYCIPYNGNENLFKTNIDCDKFFKVWEE